MKKITTPNDPAHHIAVFQENTIRRVWHNEEWWFAIVDVVGVLTDSSDPRQYIKKMRSRDPALDANWGTTCTPLTLQAPDGKQRETNCANTEGLFRIIQSIPSPKAEPFKRWLAQVFQIALWLHRIGQHTHHVNNGKPPFLVVPDAANGGFLEYRDVVRGFVGRGDFGHIAPKKLLFYTVVCR